MKTARLLLVAAFAIAFGLPSAHAQSVQVKDWDVYVDLPTGFAFVKTPVGWTFVRQLDDEQLARLPESTLTALLPPDQSDIHYAHPALEASPRMLAMHALDRQLASVTPSSVQR